MSTDEQEINPCMATHGRMDNYYLRAVPDPRALLDQLIHIRTQTGVLQATVARRMGVSANAISRLENDHGRDPKLSTLVRYADALGVHIRIHNPKAEDQ